MSVNGISGGLAATLIRPQETGRPRVEQDRAATQAPQAQTATMKRPAGAALLAPRQEALPAEAPEGTDPKLWEVLTTEERAFFARMTSMGPLTYGRASTGYTAAANPSGERPLLRGGRIDVKA